MKKKIIIIGIVLIVVVVGVYFFIINPPEKEATISYYTPGDYFVSNIKDSTRLLQTTIVFELLTYDSESMDTYLTENNHVIRDTILFIFREKTEEELRATGIEDKLREEIVTGLKQELELDDLQTIYFNDFVIQ